MYAYNLFGENAYTHLHVAYISRMSYVSNLCIHLLPIELIF